MKPGTLGPKVFNSQVLWISMKSRGGLHGLDLIPGDPSKNSKFLRRHLGPGPGPCPNGSGHWALSQWALGLVRSVPIGRALGLVPMGHRHGPCSNGSGPGSCPNGPWPWGWSQNILAHGFPFGSKWGQVGYEWPHDVLNSQPLPGWVLVLIKPSVLLTLLLASPTNQTNNHST